MPIAITSVRGSGGDPPTQIVVTGTVETCERVEVVTSCSRQPVLVDIPTGGPEPWTATLPNDEGCPCGAEIKVSARCTIGQPDQADVVLVIGCGGCRDDPVALWDDPYCLHSLSKNLSGRIRVSERTVHECREDRCQTLRTSGLLASKVTSNAPCDSAIARPLRGTIEARLVSAFDTDATRRGIHAGTFEWQATPGTLITGELSGTVNAGILRARPFDPACEKCEAPGVLIGRLCGRVERTDVDALRTASVLAVYRLQVARPTATLAGAFKGTLEGAVLPPC